MTTNILVIGDDYAVTRNVLNYLIKNNDDCSYSLLHPQAEEMLVHIHGVKPIEAPFTDEGSLSSALKTADGLICLNPIEDGNTKYIVNLCEKNGVKRVLFFSMATNYMPGNMRLRAVVEEAEATLHKSFLDWTLLNSSLLCGLKNDPLTKLINKLKKRKSSFIFVPNNTLRKHLRPIHVSDIARAIATAFFSDHTFCRKYNICGQKPLTIHAMLSVFCKKMGKHKVVPIPNILASLFFIHNIHHHFPYSKPAPLSILKVRKDSIFTQENALHDFGFNPQPFDIILDELVPPHA